MRKVAIVTINNPDANIAKQITQCCKAVAAASQRSSFFRKENWGDADFVVVSVLDRLTVTQLKENADKFGIKNYLLEDDDSRYTVLLVGPEEGERLNKLSANLRLF